MAKGGFFRGFRPVMPSSAGAFAKRGDPWVTDREGKRDFNRQVEIENPDMDADRQRLARIRSFSKEFQDKVRPDFDFKMTMREAIETERSVRMDSYAARKAEADRAGKAFGKPNPKPKSGQWPEKGKDFSASVHHRTVNVAAKLHRELRALENEKTVGIRQGRSILSIRANVNDEALIPCPYSCGYTTHDSKNIRKHLLRFRNKSCRHSTSCQCVDCKYSRNEL